MMMSMEAKSPKLSMAQRLGNCNKLLLLSLFIIII